MLEKIDFYRQAVRTMLLAVSLALPPCLATGFALPSKLHAADQRLLEVQGSAEVDSKADVMELSVTVIANEPLAGAALKSFRQSKQRALEAIRALKLEGLTVEPLGLSIHANQPGVNRNFAGGMVLQPNPRRAVVGNNACQEVLELRVQKLDRLSEEQINDLYVKLADGLKNAKVAGLGTPTLAFRLDHPQAAQQKALELAIADARTRADRLAGLLKIKIGKVARASEEGAGLMQTSSGIRVNYRTDGRGAPVRSTRPKITVSTTVHVAFEIVD